MKYDHSPEIYMDAAVVVYMKEGKTYEEWEELMLDLYDNKKEVAEGKIVYGKANDGTAIILRFDFDPAEMAKASRSGRYEKVAEVVEKGDVLHISHAAALAIFCSLVCIFVIYHAIYRPT